MDPARYSFRFGAKVGASRNETFLRLLIIGKDKVVTDRKQTSRRDAKWNRHRYLLHLNGGLSEYRYNGTRNKGKENCPQLTIHIRFLTTNCRMRNGTIEAGLGRVYFSSGSVARSLE